jgi:hypothetical protein
MHKLFRVCENVIFIETFCKLTFTSGLTEANAINFTYELDMKIKSTELGSQVGTLRHDGDNNNNPQNALTTPHIEDDNNNIRANICHARETA